VPGSNGRGFGDFRIKVPMTEEEKKQEALRNRRASLCLAEAALRSGSTKTEQVVGLTTALSMLGLLPEEEAA